MTPTAPPRPQLLTHLQNVAARAIPRRLRTGIFYALIGVDDEFTVLSGNFSGMKYVNDSVGGQFYPKILGTYELELAPILRSLREKRIERIIDVGAAESHYAVGLAMTNQRAHILAFEATSEGMRLIQQMAVANGVEDRIEIKGYCTPEALSRALGHGHDSLIVMDVEGFEDQLIDLDKCPGLAHATLLIELHDYAVAGLAASIRQRLGVSHDITEVWERARTMDDFPIPMSWLRRAAFRKLLLRSMNEHRIERMRWFYCEPREHQGDLVPGPVA